eukprot:tig00021318_g20142.t1
MIGKRARGEGAAASSPSGAGRERPPAAGGSWTASSGGVQAALESSGKSLDFIVASLDSLHILDDPEADSAAEEATEFEDDTDAQRASECQPAELSCGEPAAGGSDVGASLAAHGQDLPPFRLRTIEAERLLRDVQEAHDALAARIAAAGEPNPARAGSKPGAVSVAADSQIEALRRDLVSALARGALLGTSLFSTFEGRARLRSYFATMRESSRGQAGAIGARMASWVAQRLQEHLLEPLPVQGGDEGGPGWSAADASLLLDRFFDFVRALTWPWEGPGPPPDLFLLERRAADRLVLRGDDVSLPFAGTPLRAKFLCFRSFVRGQYGPRADAIAACYEAWAELRKRGMVPCPLEADLILRLAYLYMDDLQHEKASEVLAQGYVAGETEREVLEGRARLLRMSALECMARNDGQGAEARIREALAAYKQLGPAFRLLRPRALFELGFALAVQGSWASVIGTVRRACGELAGLGDPSNPDADFMYPFLLLAPLAPKLFLDACRIFAQILKNTETSRSVPVLAHLLRGCAACAREMGDERLALAYYERAAEAYGAAFGHVFFHEHPRIRAIAGAPPRPAPPTPLLPPRPRAAEAQGSSGRRSSRRRGPPGRGPWGGPRLPPRHRPAPRPRAPAPRPAPAPPPPTLLAEAVLWARSFFPLQPGPS